jgi:hypothetical protein
MYLSLFRGDIHDSARNNLSESSVFERICSDHNGYR